MDMKLSMIRSLVFLVICIGCSNGTTTFYVGGKNGWVVDPRESYNHWAERNRFQVNYTLVFKYRKGLDSVLVVNEEAYHSCNKTNPLQTLLVNDGNSVFKFKTSGPFFFISGQEDKCENGQKLIIVVMAVRSHHSTPPTPPPVIMTTTPTPQPVSVLQAGSTHDAPVPAPATATSGVITTTCVGGSIGFILSLSLVLKLF